jgi:hypothetical protein
MNPLTSQTEMMTNSTNMDQLPCRLTMVGNLYQMVVFAWIFIKKHQLFSHFAQFEIVRLGD